MVRPMKKFCCGPAVAAVTPRFTSGLGTLNAPSVQVRGDPEHEKVRFSSCGNALLHDGVDVTFITSVAVTAVQALAVVVGGDCAGFANAGEVVVFPGALE